MKEVGIVKAYRLSELFYEKCAVQKPSLIGDGTCNTRAPYNTDGCGFDGGDCVNSASPSLSPTLTPAPFIPTIMHSPNPSLSHSPSSSQTNYPSFQPSISASPTIDPVNKPPQVEEAVLSLTYAPECPSSLSFDLMADYYPGETSWTLHDGNGVLVESGLPVGDEYEPSKLYSFNWDLDRNKSYCIVVRDSFGDGVSSSVYILFPWCTTECCCSANYSVKFGSKYSVDISFQ